MNGPYNSILETIGNTPVVRINKLAPEGINLFAKLEAFNPMGSVKDRLALEVIEVAERSGALKPGQTVVEATSGNTGIGLAMVCAQKGYPLVIVMAESFSVERRRLMRFLGAKVVLTPAALKGSGMLNKATELAEKHGWFLTRQFDNQANADVHSRTTAQEILRDFPAGTLDCWVTGYGTGGTLKGVARVLRQQSPNTRIAVCEPDNSALLASGQRQVNREDGNPGSSHPAFRPHLMQGWTPDFISRLTEEAMTEELIDEVVPVPGETALHYARELARREGIFVGISAGATFAGAIEAAKSLPRGSNVLCMMPDTGERYLSTPLFDDIPADMDAEEMDISCSTEGARFDIPSALPPPAEIHASSELNPEAVQFLEQTINSDEQPIVMFALEWCEFCWSVRKFFKQCDIEYQSIDLDSVEFQTDQWGGKIREALSSQTGEKTIPQIFVGGVHIGGCTEVFDAYNSGALQTLMEKNGVTYDTKAKINPYELLPRWLQAREAS